MTHAVSETLLRAVHAQLEQDDYGWMSDVLENGDYRDDIDVTVDGPLKPIIAAVVSVLAQINQPLYTERLEKA